MSSHVSLSESAELLRAFRETAEKLAALAAGEGIALRTFAPEGPVHFARLDAGAQAAVLANLQRYVEVCEGVVASGDRLVNEPAMLWRMFLRLGVRPLSDFMARVESGDIIEIYDDRFVQVFRNLRFFSLCSYTLDELVSRPFWELFRRHDSVTHVIVEAATAALSGRILSTQPVETGIHTIDEIHSPMLYHSVVENKLLAPLFGAGSGKVEAVVTTIRSISCVSRARSPGPVSRREGARSQEL